MYYADLAVCFGHTGPTSETWKLSQVLTPLPPTILRIEIFASYILPPDPYYPWRACREVYLKPTGPSVQSAWWVAMGGTDGAGGNLAVFCQQPAQQASFEAHEC